jgi:beta-ureidopropionase / N-carbamoyl-L-amino-acid hydrolase
VRALNDAKVTTRRPIAVAFFTNEEGGRFQPDMLGSLVYAGGLGLNEAYAAADKDGRSVGDELRRIGYLGSARPGALRPHAFVELHIEQGPILDEEKVRIGVVESVQGISWTEYAVTGVSNHAGTTPMRLRRDAGYLAAAVNVFARKLAWEMGGHQVATVGALSLRPNLINVVPNHATFTVDLRNTDEERLKEAEARVTDHIAEVAKQERLEVAAKVLARFEPVIFDTGLVDRVEHHAKALSLSTRRMPSGAGHDAQMMQRICPTAMIFVPSVAGLSHNVKEHTEAADLAAGAQVLFNLMVELAEGA